MPTPTPANGDAVGASGAAASSPTSTVSQAAETPGMAAGVGRGSSPHATGLGAADGVAVDTAQTTEHGTSPFPSPRAATANAGAASGALRRAAAANATRESAAAERLDVQWLHVNRHRIVNTPTSTATAAERSAFRPFVEYEIEVQQFGARPCRVWHRYTAFRDFRDKLATEVCAQLLSVVACVFC